MKDGWIRTSIKAVARFVFQINLTGTRLIWRLRGLKPYRLGGQCQMCAACCEAPGIQVGWVTWYFPTIRWLFIQWHQRVNGFILKDRHLPTRTFIFECTHFDRQTRTCDSYHSRPGMCRDYPRALMWSARPEMLPGCGYRPVDPRGSILLEALKREGLDGEALNKVRERLYLE
jgi:Fe-S-cluster containining protein